MAGRISLGILASGEGLTFEGLVAGSTAGRIPAQVAILLTDRPGAPVLARAERLGIPAVCLPRRGVPDAAWADRADRSLAAAGAELLVLAGFLSILPREFVDRWAGRAVNLHPSLLPKYGGPGFYGLRVLRAALAAGDRETGATVHLVTASVDRGEVLEQRRLPIDPGESVETLRERLRPVELEALESVIRRFAERSGRTPPPTGRTGAAPGAAGRGGD